MKSKKNVSPDTLRVVQVLKLSPKVFGSGLSDDSLPDLIFPGTKNNHLIKTSGDDKSFIRISQEKHLMTWKSTEYGTRDEEWVQIATP